MQDNFKPFIDRLIDKYEGGYGWNRRDPGGPTKYGITAADLAEHRGTKVDSFDHWASIVKAMSRSEAEDIYKAKYATAIKFNGLRTGVDCCILDYAVNSGIDRAIRVARALVAAGSGPRLTTALVAFINEKDPSWFVTRMCEERMLFLKGLKTWGDFGRGWTARVTDLERYCINLIKGSPTTVPGPITPVPKGKHVAPNPVGRMGAAVGTAAGGGATVHTAGLPPWVGACIIGASIAGGLAVVLWEQHKAVQANTKVVLPPTIPPTK